MQTLYDHKFNVPSSTTNYCIVHYFSPIRNKSHYSESFITEFNKKIQT